MDHIRLCKDGQNVPETAVGILPAGPAPQYLLQCVRDKGA